MKEGDSLTPLTIKESGCDFIVYPPYQGAHDPMSIIAGDTPPREIVSKIHPATPQVATSNVTIDHTSTITANVLQIDTCRESFNRSKEVGFKNPETDYDPPIGLFIQIANTFIAKLRSVTKGVRIKPLGFQLSSWRLQYLTDTEEELEHDPALFRRAMGGDITLQATGISSVIWSAVNKLDDDYKPTVWRTLLYDARAILPEIGPSIILASTALETLIEATLGILVSESAIPDKLWEWIRYREDKYFLKPSFANKFDVLLEAVAGKSLKSNNALWEGFKKIKDARDSFVHKGVPVINGEVVTYTKTLELIEAAQAVIEWIEAMLPIELQPPKLEGTIELEARRAIL